MFVFQTFKDLYEKGEAQKGVGNKEKPDPVKKILELEKIKAGDAVLVESPGGKYAVGVVKKINTQYGYTKVDFEKMHQFGSNSFLERELSGENSGLPFDWVDMHKLSVGKNIEFVLSNGEKISGTFKAYESYQSKNNLDLGSDFFTIITKSGEKKEIGLLEIKEIRISH